MTSNLDWLTARPIAHRGLHDASKKIYENTLSACKAAIDGNFHIEVDLHLASDNMPVIFHDLTMERMSVNSGKVRHLNSRQLRDIKIGESNDYVATLSELLKLTQGKVGLVLELKGIVGEDEGFVESIANCLTNYNGPVAIMSFSHWLLKDVRKFAPDVALGLVGEGDEKQYPSHKMIAEECAIDFLSYSRKDLPSKFATEFRKSGKPVICWTVKNRQQQQACAQYTDQITFEGFNPDVV